MSDKTLVSAPRVTQRRSTSVQTYNLEQTLVLDQLYVCLTSLANVYDPGPDYMGIQDEETLTEFIRATIEQLPAGDRRFWRNEVARVTARLKKGEFEAVKNSLLEAAAEVSASIAQSPEPAPESVRLILQRHSESD